MMVHIYKKKDLLFCQRQKTKAFLFRRFFLWTFQAAPRRTAGYAKKKNFPYNAPRRGTKSPSSRDGSFSNRLYYSTFKAQKQTIFPAIIFYYFQISHILSD
ncbi:hypothetical protein [Dysosmobacter sp.]|uniref:hypothetical protein n=1 Tax=Dysosmobacter sp. TaxID=2591382 RepID=UPI003A9177D4